MQGATEDALRAGQEAISAKIPIANHFMAALMVGAVLGFLLRPAPPKPPDPVQAAREWFENALEELIAKSPVSKKQLRSHPGDLADRAQGLPEMAALLVSLAAR